MAVPPIPSITEVSSLTPRQKEVLELMCDGLTTKLIGEKLNLSPNTIAEYRHGLLKRFRVTNAVELVNKIYLIKSSDGRPSSLKQPTPPDTLPALLVVEDDAAYREMLIAQLTQLGFPCRGVGSKSEMTAVLAEESIEHATNIVLLDLNLGEADGLTIARELRETRHSLGIVIMTVRGMVEDRIEGLLQGADTYLVKPVEIRELVAVIRNLHRRQIETWASLA